MRWEAKIVGFPWGQAFFPCLAEVEEDPFADMTRSFGRRLLLVDDDPEMHAGMRFSLGDSFDVTCVFSGEEALSSAAKETFPVVILDLQMEGLSGLETLKLLLKAENEPQKVIILTGHDTKENAIEALNLGAFRYLLKPFQKDELHGVLRQAFERYRYEREVLTFPKLASSECLQDHGLSKRQAEIALLSVQGERNRGIADRLKISERTVEKHLQTIFSVLHVPSRARLVAKIHKMDIG